VRPAGEEDQIADQANGYNVAERFNPDPMSQITMSQVELTPNRFFFTHYLCCTASPSSLPRFPSPPDPAPESPTQALNVPHSSLLSLITSSTMSTTMPLCRTTFTYWNHIISCTG